MDVKEQAAVDERRRQTQFSGTSGLNGSNTQRESRRVVEDIADKAPPRMIG